MEIRLQGVRFRYPRGAFALDIDHLVIPGGSITGLVGPNGAGKTTMLALLGGLLPLQEGDIRAGEESLQSVVRAGRSALFLQGFPPDTRLRAGDWIRLAWEARDRREPAREELAEHARRCGAAPLLPRRVDTLSAGQRQLVGLGMATAGSWDVLLLDEPFSSLDHDHRRLWWRLLRGWRDDGRTVIISSHSLAELEMLCTDFVFLHEGVVRSTRSRRELESRDRVAIRVLDAPPDMEEMFPPGSVLHRREGVGGETEFLLDLERVAGLSSIVASLEERGVRLVDLRVLGHAVEEEYDDACHD